MSETFPTAPPPVVTRLNPGDVPAEIVDRLRTGAIVAPADVGVLDLSGPGAVASFQGLLTSDIEQPGDGAFVFGALLTPKGMIVVDGWAARLGTRVRFTVSAEGRERAATILQRSVPPRLARTVDRSADSIVLRVAGAHAVAIVSAAGFPAPPHAGHAGYAVETTLGDVPLEIARASERAPFTFQITVAGSFGTDNRQVSVPAMAMTLVAATGASSTTPLQIQVVNIGTPPRTTSWVTFASSVDNVTGDAWTTLGFNTGPLPP